jgi:iron complex outermembrane receptor protein
MNVYKSPNSGDVGSAPGIQGSSPQHQVIAQSSFDISKTLELDLDFRYVSALVGQTPVVPAYSTGDIRFAWRFARQFELSLVGQNLLQPDHGEYAGDPGPLVGIKRNGYVKMTWSR